MINNDDFIGIFEQRLCDYTGAPFAVAVDRCTNAILLALEYQKKKKQKIILPTHTYMSVPMTLINYGYNVWLEFEEWMNNYQIGNTNIYDYAVGFKQNMYIPGQIQCISFQQKKRVAIGTGGAILLDDPVMYEKLKRMRHDGRTTHIGTNEDIEKHANEIMIGYHMNMTPDGAAKGILLLNQLDERTYVPGYFKNYPNLTQLPCFKDYVL
jgi:dTDP-4-amino-4,6-dideoxygalactose transaminase